MADFRFDKFSQEIGEGLIDWENDTFKAVLVDTSVWVPSKANSHYLSEVTNGALIGDAVALTNKTCVDGVLDCDDVVIPTVTAAPGTTVEGVLFYKDTADPATSTLAFWRDQTAVAGQLPAEPASNNYTIRINASGLDTLKSA